MAARVASDITEGMVVNLGIGLPTLVANFLPRDREILLHSENGILGMGPAPPPDHVDPDLMNAGKLPVYRTLTPSAEELYIREFMLGLKLGSVSAAHYARKFGTDPRVQFATPLATLKEWGFLTYGGDRIGVTREGLLQIDRLLHEFFKPEHQTGRYA